MDNNYKTVFINLIKNPTKAYFDIYEQGLYKYKIPLLVLAGITAVTNKRILVLADRHENFLLNLVTTVALGVIVGWIGIFIFSYLVSVAGKWLKGQASSDEILTAAAYATFPVFIMLISDLICIGILRSRGFAKSYADIGLIDTGDINQLVLRINKFIGFIVNFYYLFVFVIGISVIQGFTKRKAVLNLLVVMFGVAILLALLIILPYVIYHQPR